MSDVEASETGHAQGAEEPPKRGRGRPKGSLNKATIARREAEEAVTEMPLEAIVEADDEAAPPAAAKPKRASRKKAAPPPEAVPEPPEPETVPEPEPVPQPPQAPRIPDRSAARAADGGMPAKPKRAPRKPRVLPALPAAPRPAVGEAASASASATLLHEASLLDIMRAGLEHARTKHKRDRVAQYDAMFAY